MGVEGLRSHRRDEPKDFPTLEVLELGTCSFRRDSFTLRAPDATHQRRSTTQDGSCVARTSISRSGCCRTHVVERTFPRSNAEILDEGRSVEAVTLDSVQNAARKRQARGSQLVERMTRPGPKAQQCATAANTPVARSTAKLRARSPRLHPRSAPPTRCLTETRPLVGHFAKPRKRFDRPPETPEAGAPQEAATDAPSCDQVRRARKHAPRKRHASGIGRDRPWVSSYFQRGKVL